jgi:hypothetical protein
MHTGNSLPIRATFIALCATLGLALLCGCAKQGLTLLTVPPAAEEVSCTMAAPAASLRSVQSVDVLFEQALAQCDIPTTTRRGAFAPSL